MADVFRILDRFRITGIGTIYSIKINAHVNIRKGDILFDLRRNRFKVKAIEMFSRIPDGMSIAELPIGLLFELIDGTEAEGNLLVRSPEDISFIFCSLPFNPQRVDSAYEEEYQAAGLEHACALFSYEDLEMGKLALYGEDISSLAIYRGWMMTPELYKEFYDKLEGKGIILINTPEEYEKYHLLPGWYSDFQDVTAKTVWEDQGTVDSALLLTSGLDGSYIVKDYVKSRKHEWYDACFIYNIANKAESRRIIGNFIERQSSDLLGGIVLRQFEQLKSIGFHDKSGMPISEEYRAFVFAGNVMIVDDYWQVNKKHRLSEDERLWIEMLGKRIHSNFVSMDIARCADGKLIMIELGDGQVSGLQQITPTDFYRAFSAFAANGGAKPTARIFRDKGR